MTKELWKQHPAFPYPLEVSNHGRIRRIYKGGQWKYTPTAHHRTSQRATIQVPDTQGIPSTYQVSHLVGALFCPDFRKGLQVVHKDGDKQNCHADNLQWITRQEAMKSYKRKTRK